MQGLQAAVERALMNVGTPTSRKRPANKPLAAPKRNFLDTIGGFGLFIISWQNMSRRDGGTEGTSRRLTDFADVINAAGWAWRNFSSRVQFDVGRKVIWKTDPVTVGQTVFQRKLICRSVNLAKVVDTRVGWTGAVRSCAPIRNSYSSENSSYEN